MGYLQNAMHNMYMYFFSVQRGKSTLICGLWHMNKLSQGSMAQLICWFALAVHTTAPHKINKCKLAAGVY